MNQHFIHSPTIEECFKTIILQNCFKVNKSFKKYKLWARKGKLFSEFKDNSTPCCKFLEGRKYFMYKDIYLV